MRFPRQLAAVALALTLGVAHSGPLQAVRVQPSGAEVPANLLRVSIEFAQPAEGTVLSRIALLGSNAAPLRDPFLPQELWSPDGTILTILLHPGRVKTGLIARQELGPILAAGDQVTLALDGRPIKRWRVGRDDLTGPVASAWKLAPVCAGSRQALNVTLDAPVDGRAADYLAVADSEGRRLAGRALLKNGERIWSFIPDRPWSVGRYTLVARGTLEDAAGNRLSGRFETSIGASHESAPDAEIGFIVAR
jgi:hypothetical protein